VRENFIGWIDNRDTTRVTPEIDPMVCLTPDEQKEFDNWLEECDKARAAAGVKKEPEFWLESSDVQEEYAAWVEFQNQRDKSEAEAFHGRPEYACKSDSEWDTKEWNKVLCDNIHSPECIANTFL
jgi:hypothetical protein